ncbi:hypothetical protein N24_2968 [Corynebacterium suranareeae]|uniref:Uncharacterized protein n=1 Tax=Corynebacterium suranareeae TaxID=2506452 RepID=A0A169S748_9CORY|nr:hypothetical protein N24_2968 [Corynebacterium suranareeae]
MFGGSHFCISAKAGGSTKTTGTYFRFFWTWFGIYALGPDADAQHAAFEGLEHRGLTHTKHTCQSFGISGFLVTYVWSGVGGRNFGG